MAEYRIDDLAREAGVSVRNVRVYQDRGLLPPPRKVGRTGYYDDSHLARLKLIGRMLDRGYTFVTIGELLNAAQYGLRIEDVLETEDPDGPATRLHRTAHLSRSEVADMFDGKIDDADIERGIALGAFSRDGDELTVQNPALLDAAKVLFDVGLSVSDVLDRTERVRDDLTSVAQQFVRLVVERYLPGGGDPFSLEPSELSRMAELILALRPLASQTVQSLFTDAMDEQITHAMEAALRAGPDSSGDSLEAS
jgi:DNA-binding transcriptional MerR regulator